MTEFVANPHALIKDGVVTQVVYMQDYSDDVIQEKLKEYDFDEVVRWEDYGEELHIGYVKIKDWIVFQIHPDWIFDEEEEAFVPPEDWGPHYEDYFAPCVPCEEDHSKEESTVHPSFDLESRF